jgi:hypothetical protein
VQRLELNVGRIVIEADLDEWQLARLSAALGEGLRLLAERLRQGPAGRFVATGSLALERLRLSTLAPEELLGPRGAERLAEDLYLQLLKRMT